jgi:hypothetical protein
MHENRMNIGDLDRFAFCNSFNCCALNSTDFGPQQTPKTPRNRLSALDSGRRVISSSGPIVIAQPSRRKCRGASRSLISRNSICTATWARTQTHFYIIRKQLLGDQDRKYVDCPHIIIRRSSTRLLFGSSARTARSMVASFPFLCIASPNK